MSVREALAIAKQLGDDDDDDNGMIDACHQSPKKGHNIEGPVRLHKTQPMDHHDGPDFMHRHCDPRFARGRGAASRRTCRRPRSAERRPTARQIRTTCRESPIVDAPAALIVKRAMGRKVVKDAQRQANMLSRLKQGARAPLGVAVAEALRTTKDAADAEFRQSRGSKPRHLLGLSTPGLPLHSGPRKIPKRPKLQRRRSGLHEPLRRPLRGTRRSVDEGRYIGAKYARQGRPSIKSAAGRG